MRENISVSRGDMIFTVMRSLWKKNEAVCWGQKLAKELKVVLPISFYEKEVNNLYNSVACIDADGELLGVYRKTTYSR